MNFARGAFLGALFGWPLAGVALWVIDRFGVLDAIHPEAFRGDEAYLGSMMLLALGIWLGIAALGGLLWLKLDRRPKR